MTSEKQTRSPNGEWKPRIVAFFCNWCTYTAADLAGVSRMKHAANVRIIRLMCSGRVDPQFVMEALARGADGVLIGGCHPNDCHYAEGNYKCLRRYQMLKRMVADMGIETERLRLEWISAAEGEKVKRVINEMTETLAQLGPLGIPQKVADWDKELEDFAQHVAASEAAVGCGCAEHGTQPQRMETAHA
jgi:F420-non-reducing hydrogenase iron-sulfur subunit